VYQEGKRGFFVLIFFSDGAKSYIALKRVESALEYDGKTVTAFAFAGGGKTLAAGVAFE
jgi:hypothetical protein